MPLREPRPIPPAAADRPAVDEWGIYDPSQAGLEALYDRIEAKRSSTAEPDGLNVAASMLDAKRLAQKKTEEK